MDILLVYIVQLYYNARCTKTLKDEPVAYKIAG